MRRPIDWDITCDFALKLQRLGLHLGLAKAKDDRFEGGEIDFDNFIVDYDRRSAS